MSRQFSQKAQDLMTAKSRKGLNRGGEALRAWRDRTGITLREIAETIGCTQAIIVCWCGGKHVPTIEIARRIEALTGIPIVWWVLPPDERGTDTVRTPGPPARDTIADIESLTLDAPGPAVELEPVRGPSDLEDILASVD